jgi:polysaccharide biosynthesis protein PslG
VAARNSVEESSPDMDKRVLAAIAALVAVVVVVGLIFALRGDDDNDTVAQDPGTTPVATPAGTPQPDATPAESDDATPETTPETTPAETPDESTDDADDDQDQNDDQDTADRPPMDPGGEVQRPMSGLFAYGFNIAWRGDAEGGEFNRMTREAVDNAGFNWIRFQIHWASVQPGPDWWDPLALDRIVEEYEGSDTRILVSIVHAPDWARDPSGESLLANYDDFAGVMHFLADRYRGRIHAWEIWNEQNMAYEMGGFVRIEDYARLLEAGFVGVKQADPDALIVFGGLTPTGVNDPSVAIDDVEYLDQFYTFGNGFYLQFFDVMGMHLNATNNPPHTMWPDEPGPGEWTNDGSFYFRRGEQLHDVMVRYGDNRPVWVTEFGWTTENQAAGYEYGAEISEEDQATYLVQAFEWTEREWPWVTGMFVWNLNFSTLVPEEDEKFPWSVLYADWSPRPAYHALQQMPKQ